MKLIHRIDANGYFVEDVILESNIDGTYTVPADCVDVHPPQPIQMPQWVNGAWVDAGFPYARDDSGNLIIPSDTPEEGDDE